jgi:hypothetical protein
LSAFSVDSRVPLSEYRATIKDDISQYRRR